MHPNPLRTDESIIPKESPPGETAPFMAIRLKKPALVLEAAKEKAEKVKSKQVDMRLRAASQTLKEGIDESLT